MYVCIYVCMYVCMYVCTYVCIHVSVCMYKTWLRLILNLLPGTVYISQRINKHFFFFFSFFTVIWKSTGKRIKIFHFFLSKIAEKIFPFVSKNSRTFFCPFQKNSGFFSAIHIGTLVLFSSREKEPDRVGY